MKAVNLFLLASIIGVELILGIVVAPTIFFPQNLIGEGVLSHFQSGLMMTQIFIKMGYLLIFVSVVNFLYEIYSLIKDEIKFQIKFQIKFSKFMLSLLILILSLIFVFYFTNTIIELQNLGENATKTQEFISIHNASEVVIKIILIMQVFLYFLSFKIAKK
ncbi:DUF4149 domain-containing protein [Campylobacter jejuni]|uniref:DUF4149 domain-containing protein n=1 Tax=Campylobacter jejuni TaxID=197 RepID=UPI000F80D0D2|nr:DUF4149 domain-containing protein [Campylobacter jejuni]RTI68029.1 DUF4149 domain-containing protein [Campylobacter jejuni]RTI90633.1 DUF4149 domain-containing protein [Campylobacter jejuni]RTJ16592.1 DUF4149 domain-containing protein [Campylobacter jejuni]RTJ25616.1 DUF4149 domain-containing protein [Campylobacter jejuni]RTJ28776.1 DUF4149 domain-containing protein [Campylobacter jejuni]